MVNLNFTKWIATIAVGVFAGTLSGFLGVTPGGILVPCLALIIGGGQHKIQAISLVAQLFPTSIAGFRIYQKAGHLTQIRSVLPVAVGYLPGAYLGARAAMLLSDQVLRWVFVAYLIILAVSVAIKGNSKQSKSETYIPDEDHTNTSALTFIGGIAGFSSGFLGIGGGLAIIALLTILLSVRQHEAQAISLAVGALPLASPAIFVYTTIEGGLPWTTSAFVIVGLIVGTLIGAWGATRLNARALHRYFVALIFIMAALMAYQALTIRQVAS